MDKKQMVVPLALVAMLWSALFRAPLPNVAAGGQTSTASASKNMTPNESAERRQSGVDDPLDTFDVLAESLGVDISTEGLKRRAKRAVKTLGLRGDDAAAVAHAASYLSTFFDLPIRKSAPRLDSARRATRTLAKQYPDPDLPASQIAKAPWKTAPGSPVDEVDRFLTKYFDQDVFNAEHPNDEKKLLALDFERLDKTSLKIAVLRQVAADQKADVGFLIATLPDPIDSFTGWQFDPMLDAISQAIAANKYVFDRFHFPDLDREQESGTSGMPGAGAQHEREPGVVVFRRHSKERPPERLVLLIVHENPSAGVHPWSLANAIRLITLWNDPEGRKKCSEAYPNNPGTNRPDPCTIRILGPTFSGSRDSIRGALTIVKRRIVDGDYHVRFVSGSATDPSNKTTIEHTFADTGAVPACDANAQAGAGRRRIVFQATVLPDDILLKRLTCEIDELGWSSRVAVLFEGNTLYGQGVGRLLNENPSRKILMPFPMNISRLRSTAQHDKPGLADARWLPSKFRPLSMEETGRPADQIPQFSPKTTASYVELALAGMLRAMRREHVGTVGLMATDPRDKLFLAQQIALYSPDVSIFTAESDSLYIHPDYSAYLQGALVVSTYPLYTHNQSWSYGFQGGAERRQFANGSAQGIYNAALALLDYDERGNRLDSQAAGDDIPRLLEYGLPGEDFSRGCRPPVWISVVGRSSAWPVRAYRVASTDTDYVFPISAAASAPRGELFPSTLFSALFISLTSAILVCWVGARNESWRTAAGHRQQLVALVEGRGSMRGRGYLLTCLASLFVIETFIEALCLMRFQIERSIWATVLLATACMCLAALADLARRLIARLSQDLPHLHPKRIFAWGALTVFGAAWIGLQLYVSALPTHQSIGFLARAIDLGSGVCPTLPVLFLGIALTLWALTELARLRNPRVALSDEAVHLLVQQSINGDVEDIKHPWDLLNRSTLAVPRGLRVIAALMATVICIFLFDPIVRPLVTIEGPWFGRSVSIGLLLVEVMISLSLLQFLFLWSALKRLLERMAWHHLAASYARVPRELFPTGLFPSVPRLMELEVPVAHWQRSFETTGRPAAGLDLRRVFQDEMRASPSQHWSGSRTWTALVNAACLSPVDPAEPVPGVQKREELAAMLMALLVRDALARLGHNLVFVISGMILVFCSQTLFPFQAHRLLAAQGWTFAGLAFLAILTVLIQMKRSDVLSRLTSAAPDKRTTWDGAFILKLTVVGLLPLLTLFAAQFPEVGAMLLHWLEPVSKALP